MRKTYLTVYPVGLFFSNMKISRRRKNWLHCILRHAIFRSFCHTWRFDVDSFDLASPGSNKSTDRIFKLRVFSDDLSLGCRKIHTNYIRFFGRGRLLSLLFFWLFLSSAFFYPLRPAKPAVKRLLSERGGWLLRAGTTPLLRWPPFRFTPKKNPGSRPPFSNAIYSLRFLISLFLTQPRCILICSISFCLSAVRASTVNICPG